VSDPWYVQIEASGRLQQGEIIVDCPFVVPRGSPTADDWEDPATGLGACVVRGTLIVMTQDCDLAQNKVHNVLAASCLDVDKQYRQAWRDGRERQGQKTDSDSWRKHRRNLETTDRLELMLLGPFPPDAGVHLVVHLHEVYPHSREWIESLIQQRPVERWRLGHPYLGKLAAKFGHLYSRIGTDEPPPLPPPTPPADGGT
jgi:hypothetical protein